MGLNWKNERATKNYCGYCIDITCTCNGDCFIDKRFKASKNRQHHLKIMIKKYKKELKKYKKELKNYGRGHTFKRIFNM